MKVNKDRLLQLCKSYSSPYSMERVVTTNSEFGYEMPTIALKINNELFDNLLKYMKESIKKNSSPKSLNTKIKSYRYVEEMYEGFKNVEEKTTS